MTQAELNYRAFCGGMLVGGVIVLFIERVLL